MSTRLVTKCLKQKMETNGFFTLPLDSGMEFLSDF